MLMIMTAIDSLEKAEALARGMVEGKLAACVQVLEEAGASWVTLSGENDVRLATAIEAVERLRP